MDTPDTRIRKLTPQDIAQLQVIAKRGYLLASNQFWLTVEEALINDDAHIQLHKCSCGALVLSPIEYVQKSKADFLKNPSVKCWHNAGIENSINYFNTVVSRRIDQIVLALKENKRLAATLAQGLLPTDNPRDFDYSLYQLEYVMWLQQAKTRKAPIDTFRVTCLIAFDHILSKAKRKNEAEYQKLLKYYGEEKVIKDISESMQIALNKQYEGMNIIAEEAYKRVTHSFTTATRSFTSSKDTAEKRNRELYLDSYQAFFEIKEILEIIYNLVNITNGNSFEPEPFKNKKVKGLFIKDKKGLMVQKILEDSKDKKLNVIVKKAYDNGFRNNTAGHNDYLIDLKKKKIINKTKKISYSFSFAVERENRITSLATTLISIVLSTEHFNHIKELSLMGVNTVSPKYKEDGSSLPQLMSTQFWSNAQLDKKAKNISTLNLKISKDRKFIYFTHGETVNEANFKFIPSKQFYEWLELVKDMEEIHYDRVIIAPKIELFLRNAKAELKLNGQDYFILGITHHTLKTIKPKIKKILKLLKGQNLISHELTQFKQISSEVRKYKDKKIEYPKQ